MGFSPLHQARSWGPAAVGTDRPSRPREVLRASGALGIPLAQRGALPRRASCHLRARQAWALLRMRRFGAGAGGLRTASSRWGQDGGDGPTLGWQVTQ